MTGWRFLHSSPASGAENMAVDELLLERAGVTGETVLRVYSWSAPTLSLGRNQRAVGIYNAEQLASRRIGVVRRPTGGRALLHDREVTYSLSAPLGNRSMRVAYAEINSLLLDGLSRMGVHAQLAKPNGRAPKPGPAPCFDVPSAGEVVVEGRKLVGSAQFRSPKAFLQHGSILLDDDQAMLRSLANREDTPPRPATLTDLLGRTPDIAEVTAALLDAARDHAGKVSSLDESELPAHAVLDVANHYRDESWTWRR